MLVMQACDKPSPQQPLGQRREFIHAAAWQHTSAGDGHEPFAVPCIMLRLSEKQGAWMRKVA